MKTRPVPSFTRGGRLLLRYVTILALSSLVLFANACAATNYIIVGTSDPSVILLAEQEIAGTWVSHYNVIGLWPVSHWLEQDRLIIREDGIFKQIYRNAWDYCYRYETPWNEWWIEARPDGNMWLHLKGARYYVMGARVGEREGLLCPNDDCSAGTPDAFLDPFSDAMPTMVGELILVVRKSASGRTILVHMCASQDGCGYEYFSRVRK